MNNEVKNVLKQAVNLQKAGHLQDSLAILKDAVEQGIRHEVVLGMLASHYAEIGLNDKAMSLYQEILTHNADNHLARFQLGHLLFAQQQYQSALDTWKPILNVPEDFLTKLYAAKAYVALNNLPEAIPLLQAALKTAPTNHPAGAEAKQILLTLSA